MNSRVIKHKQKIALVCMLVGAALMQKKRKVWSRNRLLRRQEKSFYENLMREMALEDAEGYRRLLRMNTASFELLLGLVSPLISTKDTNMRKAIPSGEKLALTLLYLATGETQKSLALKFRIAQNTISGILKLVCNALVAVLSSHLQTPSTEAEWQSVSKQFESKWQFPNCMGALNGRHVRLAPPRTCPSANHYYSGDFSILFIVLVDADMKFLFVDVITDSQMNDVRAWEKCKLKLVLEENSVHYPTTQCLPGTETNVPFVVATSDAFPLAHNMMKSFSNTNLNDEEKIFNYRLARANRVTENTFGILSARFQIFKERILTNPANASKTVLACCALHNFLLENNSDSYISSSCIDVEDINSKTIRTGDWRNYPSNALVPLTKEGKTYPAKAREVRKKFSSYFNGIGAVPWQRDMCLL